MPKLPTKPLLKLPPKPKALPSPLPKKVAELCWKYGDDFLTRSDVSSLLRGAGIRLENVTKSVLHQSIRMADERLREGFRRTNNDPRTRLRVVIPGDPEFDTSLRVG